MAGTTPVTLLKDTLVLTGSSICPFRLTNSHFINNDESSDDEDTKLKSYISRKFKKFIKNTNVKVGDKGCKQSAFSQFKSQDKGKREFKDAG